MSEGLTSIKTLKCKELIKKEKKRQIQEFLDKLDKIREYCDKWDYSIPTPFWDLIEEYQKRLKE